MPTVIDEQEIVTLSPYGVDAEGQPFPPHPSQERARVWAREVREGRYPHKEIPVLYLQHGVNAGGTRGALTPAIEYLLEVPGLQVLIGRKDFNDLRLSVMETFFRIIPQTLIVEQNVQEHRYVLLTDGGGTSTVFFRELKDIKGLGSQEFACIVVGEAHEISHDMFRTLRHRCRQGTLPSFIVLEGNPPSEGHWLTHVTTSTHPDYDPDLLRLIVPSTENYATMTPAYRASLEAMPPMWRKRYVLGEVSGLPGGTPVYPAFVEQVHVAETHLIPDRPILRFFDWGLRRPACLWSQQEDSGRLLVHREWSPLETPVETFLEGVEQRTNLWFGALVRKDYGDPAAAQRDPDGLSTLARLARRGIRLIFRQTTYADRIPLVNKKFSELVDGVPAILINPLCGTLIQGLSGGYHYPDVEEGKAFGVQRDLPFKDGIFEHVCNALEYGLVNLYGGTPTATVQAQTTKQRRWQETMATTWRGF